MKTMGNLSIRLKLSWNFIDPKLGSYTIWDPFYTFKVKFIQRHSFILSMLFLFLVALCAGTTPSAASRWSTVTR